MRTKEMSIQVKEVIIRQNKIKPSERDGKNIGSSQNKSQSPDLNIIEHAFHLLKTEGRKTHNQQLKADAVKAYQSLWREKTQHLVRGFQTSASHWLLNIFACKYQTSVKPLELKLNILTSCTSGVFQCGAEDKCQKTYHHFLICRHKTWNEWSCPLHVVMFISDYWFSSSLADINLWLRGLTCCSNIVPLPQHYKSMRSFVN